MCLTQQTPPIDWSNVIGDGTPYRACRALNCVPVPTMPRRVSRPTASKVCRDGGGPSPIWKVSKQPLCACTTSVPTFQSTNGQNTSDSGPKFR
ncbi:hypothetical protein EVAR_79764_1 [Eumeta japonica]|uniref:Uncharacterized protein n=1 Tax=Eumeta variegata TaxID=151549 RepID=A0A4C1TAB7_EUMVA|nr:hypothetical protein EVAR_79764_1 [Eumeta japonica]